MGVTPASMPARRRTPSASGVASAWRSVSASTSGASTSWPTSIHLGRRADLERASLSVEGLSVTFGDPPTDPFRALVRVRHRAPTVAAWVMPERPAGTAGGDRPSGWRVELDRPVWAPAPGQAAVLYAIDEPDRVLGGGRITEPAWRS